MSRRSWLAPALVLSLVSVARAQVSPTQVIPYSGYLEQDGTAVTTATAIDLTFYLYTAADAESITGAVWQETHAVEISAGRFSVNLGTTSALDGVVQDATELYLEIAVEDTLLGGRQQLGAVPYAWRATPAAEFVADDLTVTQVTAGAVSAETLTAGALSADTIEGDGAVPPGALMAFALDACPTGWLLADGGAGRPDARGRVLLGTSGTHPRGQTGGAETHRHQVGGPLDSDPSSNDLVRQFGGLGQRWWRPFAFVGNDSYSSTDSNMPPYLSVIYCIKQDSTP